MANNGWTLANESSVSAGRKEQSKYAISPEWIRSSTALGHGEERRVRIAQYLGTGVDEIILHGSSVFELGDVMATGSTSR
jgi:hypothetical protein